MSLSDFQKKKLTAVYRDLYDSNKDGVIDQADFKDAMQKISELHHWGKNDAAYTNAQKQLEKVWEGLRITADKNKDGKVTEEEWLLMWNDTLAKVRNGEEFPSWQKEYIHFMFLANDTSGDNLIDKDEFIAIQTLFGKERKNSEAAFKKLVADKGGDDAKISESEFEALWKEYFLSDDPGSRGNCLFGGLD